MTSARASFALLSALVLGGCFPARAPYQEPTPDAPHAAVTVVRTHLSRPGLLQTNVLHLNGLDVPAAQDSVALRVDPDAHHWFASTRFWHTEMVTTRERVEYSETEYDLCASRDYKGNCKSGTRRVWRSRMENVTRMVERTDALCEASSAYQFQAGRTYRVQFTFERDKLCSLACVQTSNGGDGAACEAWEPAKAAAVAPPTAASVRPTTEVKRPLQIPGMVTLAAGGIGMGVSLGAYFFANTQKAEIEAHCATGRVCDDAGLRAARRGSDAIDVANVAAIAGGALALGGIGMILFGPSTTVTAAPTTNGGALSVTGKF